jgi:hypothetical protein
VSKWAIAALAGLLAAALASGCGGGDRASSTPIAKGDFADRAEAICRASSRAVIVKGLAALREGRAAGESRHEIETATVAGVVLPTLVDEVRDLRRLGAPRGDEEQVAAILAAMRKPIAEAREDPQSYVQYRGRYRPGSYHYGEVSRLAKSYGLSGCPMG